MSPSDETTARFKPLPPLHLEGGAPPLRQTIAQAARSAFSSIGVHKARALLTMLGIVVGVAGVLTVLNLAVFARAANARGLLGLGANVIDVSGFKVSATAPVAGTANAVIVTASGAPSLTAADVQALEKLPHVAAVSPRSGNQLQVQAGNLNWTTQVIAGYPRIQITQGLTVQQGAFFSQADVTSGNAVAVVGQTVAKQLFPNGNAVGQQMRIGTVDFSVVGVLKPLGANGKQDLDNVVLVPITTFLQRLAGAGRGQRITTGGPAPANGGPPPNAQVLQAQGASTNPALARSNFPDVQVAVDDPRNVDSVKAAITRALEQNHGIKPPSPDDFTVGGFLQAVAVAQHGATTISWVMGAVAAVALLIGGFGVANVMLAAVAERRREIGVRLAVGAAIQDIFWQFLLEALTLSVLGGLAGAVLGLGLSRLLPRVSDQFGVAQSGPSWISVVAALGTAVTIGLAFGAYPARRAAQTDPIEALRAA